MTRNWSPVEIPSKNCRDCHKVIFLSNHKFYDKPECLPEQFHHCEKWAPKHNNDIILERIIRIEKRLDQQFLMLQEIRNLISSKLLDAREGLI